jgi:two-component system, OmpR family, alkaline phosphatase synthesis response regulator PhoP
MSRILIVEDDAAIAVALEDDLQLEGYSVQVARDGIRAVQMATETRFDLILLDVMLPHKDGFEVCRELRRRRVDSLILMLTARGEESEKVLGLELGADDYVTKPYSPKELRARVKALLRRTSAIPADEQVIQFGEYELDFGRAELRQGGRPVPMTPLELKLISLFARRPGRVFTRQLLIDELWGKDTAITERVVDNQISNLRRKIEPQYLKSIRGIGYRFDPEGVNES